MVQLAAAIRPRQAQRAVLMVMARGAAAALRYYRFALQQVKRLPPLERGYYAQYARSQFMGHSDEIDEQRIQEVADRGLESMAWVLRKFELEMPEDHKGHEMGGGS